ncbi:MAG: VPLPA-CTERM sorting domain-containing protein, partial [Pseudomonadota bacterium]|nr:VPLPA-CTERM sorting domain-containing protein [Pseudomonadota bacterium]
DMYALNELQNYILGSDLVVDSGVIAAGTKVSSHYVGFDPLFWSRQGGSVSFSGKILGVISTTDTLLTSDFLGAPAVSYTAVWERGLEPNWDKYSIGDKTVSVSWWASTPGDYMRVITAAAVPVPAGGLLLVGALGSLAAVRRRRKSA